jgi:glucose-1-phosphate cytidylyltransferase
MKAVILAGGLGTRLSEETQVRPKPMVEIGGKPILWHIMKMYSTHGINEFIVSVGYKGYMIKEFFANYFIHTSDVTFDLASKETIVHRSKAEPWKVTIIDTGDDTQTGGRIKRVKPYLGADDFCLTYGDGLSDVDLTKLIKFHHSHGKLATVTATRPPGRFGALGMNGAEVTHFDEKPQGDGGYINGGFFVLSPKCLDYIEGDSSIWERDPMSRLAKDAQLQAFSHDGFWQPMDTLREKNMLENMWQEGKAPWKTWE